ncbi:hypothetical protein ACB300_08570 [Klebsiella pneumoniae]
MTDITALAQSLKRRATSANEFGESLYVKADDVIALVEELEKAQQRIVELDRKNCELDSLTQRWAVERAENADHIAALESRTVKLPELCVGVVQGGHAVMVPYPAGHWFNKTAILEMLAAAGIKVEAE